MLRPQPRQFLLNPAHFFVECVEVRFQLFDLVFESAEFAADFLIERIERIQPLANVFRGLRDTIQPLGLRLGVVERLARLTKTASGVLGFGGTCRLHLGKVE